MKVLFITGSLNQGGAEFQILQLAKLFQDKGNEVEVFAITNYSFYKYFVVRNNLTYSHLENNQNKIKRVFLTSKKIKQFQPNLIISYLKIVSKVTIIAKILSNAKVPVIVGERTSNIQPWHDKLHFNLMRFADAVTVNSISKLDYLKANFNGISDKTYFFPNILDVTEIIYLDKNYDQDKLHLGFIGRISPEKNILEMIRAVGCLKKKGHEIQFSIYGDGRNAGYLEEVNNLILSEGLTKDVQLMGETKEVFEVHKTIDLLILISDFEGFSNVISEAIASGLPIITSNVPENKYLVKDGENGFVVNHKDSKSIAEGIEKYMQLPAAVKRKISANNREKAEGIFDKDTLYIGYIKLISRFK
jgi:glycosyltransferase involved in cell wall biosynthesis|tara:strand:- start:1194 stop:2273 length:1080 start_codon:yes stop_codon:yes gene_type:complete